MSATTAVSYDMSAIENRAPNVGRQFFDRVRGDPAPGGLPLPGGRRAGSR